MPKVNQVKAFLFLKLDKWSLRNIFNSFIFLIYPRDIRQMSNFSATK